MTRPTTHATYDQHVSVIKEQYLDLSSSFMQFYATDNTIATDGYALKIARLNELPDVLNGTPNYSKGNKQVLDTQDVVNVTELEREVVARSIYVPPIAVVPQQNKERYVKNLFDVVLMNLMKKSREKIANFAIRDSMIEPIGADTEINITQDKYFLLASVSTGATVNSNLKNGASVKTISETDLLDVAAKMHEQNTSSSDVDGRLCALVNSFTANEIKKIAGIKESFITTGEKFSWGFSETFTAFGFLFIVRPNAQYGAVYKKTGTGIYQPQAESSVITADSREAILFFREGALTAGLSPVIKFYQNDSPIHMVSRIESYQQYFVCYKTRYDQLGIHVLILD